MPGGLLGADYEVENGRYRFKKVYGGLNWTPQLRSPLTEPGVNVKAGEYLLAVNGRDLRGNDESLQRLREHRRQDRRDHRRPERRRHAARARCRSCRSPASWRCAIATGSKGNLRKVDKATNGRVAYVYVPNTADPGHAYFKRYFFPQADKDAVIVDERFNGGGQVADYYIDILRRPLVSYWAMRYGADLKTPTASIQGPKVMIIDETAGSGGDLLPWMFRKFKLGPARRQADVGRPGRHPRLPGVDGRRRHHRAEPGDLDRGRLGRRERGRAAGHRGRADAGRRDRGTRPAAGEGDRARARRAEEESAARRRRVRPTRRPSAAEAADAR